jgi:hypothetical protein
MAERTLDELQLIGLDLHFPAARVAEAVDTGVSQDALVLADIEARLTQQVRGLIAALTEFGGSAQLICKEIPDNAHFTKLVSSALVLIGFQLAYALGKGLDKPIFFDDGAEYLRELNLCLSDFAREIDLDGRRFLAIALINQQSSELGCASDGGDKC